MQHATLVGQEASEWCAGLPLDAVRPLSDVDLAALRSEARRLRWWGVLAALSLPTFSIANWLVALYPPSSNLSDALAGFLFLGLVVSILSSPLLAWRYLSRGSACARDARAGCLKRFEGRMGEGISIGDVLTQNHLLHADAEARQWLELLPSSGRLWSANGRRAPFWIILRTTTVANTPANAYAAAREVNVAENAAGGAKLLGERDLSAKEREELGGHISRAWETHAVAAILLTAWLTFLSLLDWSFRTWTAPWYVVVWVAFFVSAIWIDFAFIKGVLRAWRLNRDLKRGKILIISAPVQENGESGIEASTLEIETLPYSRSLWTSSGVPAGWRTSRV